MTREDRAYGWIHRNVIDRLSSSDTLVRKNDIKMTDAIDAMKVHNKRIPLNPKTHDQMLRDGYRVDELDAAINRRLRKSKGIKLLDSKNLTKLDRKDKLMRSAISESLKLGKNNVEVDKDFKRKTTYHPM